MITCIQKTGNIPDPESMYHCVRSTEAPDFDKEMP